MKLAELIRPWIESELPDCEILGLQNDSRKVKRGFLFFAYPGTASDGRLYINQAVRLGASAIAYEPESWPDNCELPEALPSIGIRGLSKNMGKIARRFYGDSAKTMHFTGVTGTNGKTTIAYQLAQAHTLLGEAATYIGTIGQGKVNALEPLVNTTPDALCLHELFYHYQQERIKQVCMEVSSHALSQHRVDGIDFGQAIYTNLSHEHLDYHQTMEAYAAAKAKLFEVPTLKWALVNNDDSYSAIMRRAVSKNCTVLSYGLKKGADIQATSYELSIGTTRIELNSPWGQHQLSVNVPGLFNIYNSLAVYTSLLAHGYNCEQVVAAMSKLKPAPGRMEIVSREPYAIVDYAHSPDALENVLRTLQQLQKGKIILVFGCGGDRDKDKRPMMGKIASQYADIVIVTNDNPRTENPMTIVDAILTGMNTAIPVYKILDREEAIAKAINIADKEDIVLIAGKGHEDYQQIGNVRHTFSDQAVLRRLTNREGKH